MIRSLSLPLSLTTCVSLAFCATMSLALTGPAEAQSMAGASPMSAPAKPAAPQNQCFFAPQMEDWRAPDDKTMFIRVNINEYYRIEMSSECPELTFPDPHLITIWRGSSQVCGPLDWDLKVADGTGPGSFAVACIVKSQTRMTPAEVAAIPKKFKP